MKTSVGASGAALLLGVVFLVAGCGDEGDGRKAAIGGTTDVTVTINQAATQADPTTGTTAAWTVTSSQPVGTASFSHLGVELTGAPAGITRTLTAVAPTNGAATTFTFLVRGIPSNSAGRMTATVPLGARSPASQASTSTDNAVDWSKAPARTVTFSLGSKAGPGAVAFNVQLAGGPTTPNPANDLKAAYLTLGGSAPGTKTAEIVSGTGNGPYKVTVRGMTGRGTVTASVAANKIPGTNAASTGTNTATYGG
jgi:hypothetical protein